MILQVPSLPCRTPLFTQPKLRLPIALKCYPILGQRELEFSGVKAQFGGAADEPFMSEIGTLLPIALCGRNYSIFARASSRLMNQ